VQFFARLGLKVEDALALLSEHTTSLQFISSCYSLNFFGPEFVAYIHRIQPVLERHLPTIMFADQLRLLPDLISGILLSENTQP